MASAAVGQRAGLADGVRRGRDPLGLGGLRDLHAVVAVVGQRLHGDRAAGADQGDDRGGGDQPAPAATGGRGASVVGPARVGAGVVAAASSGGSGRTVVMSCEHAVPQVGGRRHGGG